MLQKSYKFLGKRHGHIKIGKNKLKLDLRQRNNFCYCDEKVSDCKKKRLFTIKFNTHLSHQQFP